MDIVNLNNVEKSYKEQTIIKGISLQVNQGEISVLNNKMPNFNVLENIGYMGQLDSLYEDLTGMENLRYFGQLNNIKKEI